MQMSMAWNLVISIGGSLIAALIVFFVQRRRKNEKIRNARNEVAKWSEPLRLDTLG